MANGATSPTLRMAPGSLLTAAGRNKSNACCDPLAAGNRCRLGGYHSSTHAPTPATCPGQYGMDLAGSEGSSYARVTRIKEHKGDYYATTLIGSLCAAASLGLRTD